MSDPHKRSHVDHGTAGASARRTDARHRRARQDPPRVGDVMLVLGGKAAAGEQVAKQLAKHLGDRVAVLHDRRVPGSRANIDHLAIAPSGVWVVGSKQRADKVSVSKPLFGGRGKLLVDGRDETELADELSRQVALVARAIAAVAPDVPVRGTMCFAGTELPTLRRLTIDGHPLLDPRALARRIDAAGSMTDAQIRAIILELARRFPRA